MINDVEHLGSRRQGFDDDFVIGLILGDDAKAYEFINMRNLAVINDLLGETPIFVTALGQSFQAYIRVVAGQPLTFFRQDGELFDHQTGTRWDVDLGLALCLNTWSFTSQHKIFVVGAEMTALAVVFAIPEILTGSPLAKFLTFASMIVFWSMCTWFVGRYHRFVRRRRRTSDPVQIIQRMAAIRARLILHSCRERAPKALAQGLAVTPWPTILNITVQATASARLASRAGAILLRPRFMPATTRRHRARRRNRRVQVAGGELSPGRKKQTVATTLRGCLAIWAGPGDYENPDEVIKAIRFCREQQWPFMGT